MNLAVVVVADAVAIVAVVVAVIVVAVVVVTVAAVAVVLTAVTAVSVVPPASTVVAVVVVVPPPEVLQVVAPLVVALAAALHLVVVLVVLVALAVVLVEVLPVAAPRLKARHSQLVVLPLNAGLSLSLRMFEPLAQNVQDTGLLAESSIYSPIISQQRSIRAPFIITTVHTLFYSRRVNLTGPPFALFPCSW